jgi:hypothetical protein
MSATTVTAIKSADPAATTNGAARPPAMTSTQRSQLKRARDAAAAAALADAATVPSVASTVAPKVQRAIGAALIVTAVLLAGVGMTATVDYSLTTAAAAAADRYLLAALAAAADSLTLMLPSAAFAVWSSRRRGLALAAVLLWIAAAGITTTTLAGFIGVNGDAFLTGRETAATERSLVLERVARLRAERGAISESRPVGVILVAIRNAAKSVIDDERAALLVARRRDQIDADLAVLEGTIRALPPTSIADPASNTIAGVVHLFGGVAIAAATLQRVRFALLLALPLLGGAVLAIGGALVGRRAP